MKFVFRKISFAWIFLVALFIPGSTKAASKKDIPERINKVRETINNLPALKNSIELTGKDFAGNNNSDLNKWVNWGNWANWNNWSNWANWNNWSNWGNWRNY
jgi:hypothetical protein